MINVSPYADAESGAPSWATGEKEAACVFLSLALYIILDVNVAIYRVFRRKQGLYYWSLIFATWGTATVVVGNILKNLKPEWSVIWPLWTLMINGGWSIYAPAELLVLYSRLHLVNQNDRLHRWLLVMIIVGSTLIIIPNWVFIFPAYDIDPTVSSVWSPRMAIIDRVSQAGFTIFEIIISSVYIHSLLDILRTKINMRTRRVMRDLILVNITVICMDLLVITLIFLNQANLAYPLQDFIYAFKFKIEFAVLNQLMAVAASGSRHGSRQITWEEKRYRQPGQATILKGYSDDDMTGVRLPCLSTSGDGKASPQRTLVAKENHLEGMEVMDHAQLAKPSSIVTREQMGMETNVSTKGKDDISGQVLDQNFKFSPSPDLRLSSSPSSPYDTTISKELLQGKESEDRPLAPVADDGKDLTLANVQASPLQPPQRKRANRISLRQMIFGKQTDVSFRNSIDKDATERHDSGMLQERDGIVPFGTAKKDKNATSESQLTNNVHKTLDRPVYRRLGSKRKEPRERRTTDDGKDGVHAWEKRGAGRFSLEAPWFQKEEEQNDNDAASKYDWV